MDNLAELIQSNPQLTAAFLHEVEVCVLLAVDEKMSITQANKAFKKMIGDKEITGKNVFDYLSEESRALFPFESSCGAFKGGITFKKRDGDYVSIYCHMFKTEDAEYLIFGENSVLSDQQILQKMTLLSNDLTNLSRDLYRKNQELTAAKKQISSMGKIIPICMHCKGVRDDQGYWKQVEEFIAEESGAALSHGLCEACAEKHYPELALMRKNKKSSEK